MNSPINTTAGKVNAAEKQYNQLHGELLAKLETLQSLIDAHSQSEKIHWGHVGDLRQVSEYIDHAIDFLGGEESLS